MNIPPDVMDALDVRSRTIVHCCSQWYSQDRSRCVFLMNILQRRAGYSLRLVDWMVTNYCKRHPLIIVHKGNPTNIHNDYERHLAVYNKRYYDPFARRKKIKLDILGVKITSTVGQLNFFKWFIERDLNDVVKLHQSAIESDMKTGGKKEKSITSKDPIVHRGNFQVGFL